MNIPDKEWLTIAEAIDILAVEQTREDAKRLLQSAWSGGRLRVEEERPDGSFQHIDPRLADRLDLDPIVGTLVERTVTPNRPSRPKGRIADVVFGTRSPRMVLDLDPLTTNPSHMTENGRPRQATAPARGKVWIERASFATLFAREPDTTEYRTGAPGRPTSRHLVEAEASRRIEAGDVPAALTAFAAELKDWLDEIRDERAPTMAPKTIEDAVRGMWHRRSVKT